MRAWWAVLLIMSGCFGGAPSPEADAPQDPPSPPAATPSTPDNGTPQVPRKLPPTQNTSKPEGITGFTTVDSGAACPYFCEPVVAADGPWLFVLGNGAAKGNLGSLASTSAPAHVGPPGTVRGDQHIQIAPDGSLWYSSLVVQISPAFVLHGIQVARSLDHGSTWPLNALMSPAEGMPPSAGADRQWLTFDGGRVFVSYQGNPAIQAGAATPDPGHIWVSLSEDDGQTWSPFHPVTLDGEDLARSHVGGPPVASGGGIAAPFLLNSGLHIAHTTDGRQATIADLGVQGTSFPQLVSAKTGLVAYYWSEEGISSAREPSWEPTLLWEGEVLAAPWAEAGPEGLDVVWLARTPGSAAQFDVIWIREGSPPATVATGLVGAEGGKPNTDFAHFTYVDGRLVIAASDRVAKSVLLFVEQAS